ncbi:AAA family ATPase [Halorubrum ezzemoulense]|uniref:DNA helicase n=1 Tax=Halorubrum ezzemoulense TaxID=337243 RepID=A0A256IW92_HALEZ|nr:MULTISPECIES: AAA domain-containing protein [Halorubrum]OYR60397.1 AAA family ATPase [Halorubrum ezzemoulense]OYR77943.1 AAA family ATPase [Halorubrum ezzemoulense]PHQ43061.1 AAA family ATPase [Halorubrum sp. C191]QAY20570.1 AAA family ATPase [Halorubrum ezzemoulense]
MNVRGPIVSVGEARTVSTSYGERDLREVRVRPDRGAGDPVDVTLWGKWTEVAEHAEPGMELLVTDPEEDEYRGETGYATTDESWVVLEPDFLVDVTGIRSWVQCPRMYYLNKLSGIPLNYPVVKGTIVHEVFGDLLRGMDLDESVAERVAEAGLELGLLGYETAEVEDEVRRNAAAVEGWLAQGTLADEDTWRSEFSLISPTFGLKGRADALRRGTPVELKTGKNTKREPRFHDKVQAACYALMLDERGVDPDIGTLLYTKNTALDRNEESGDLAPAKEFTVGRGFLEFVVRERNALAAAEWRALNEAGERPAVPTGYEADATCSYCFEQDACMVVSGRLDQESKAGQIGTPVPEEERDYFDRFYVALEEERRETHAEYRKLWEQTPEERAADDRALIGLEPVAQTEIDDARWELRAKKPSDAVSKLREGDVALASDGDPVSGHAELGRITALGSDEVVVETDEPVELRRLDVYPSEISVDRSLTALHDAVLKGDPDRKDVIFGRRNPSFRDPAERPPGSPGADDPDAPDAYIDNNAAQNEAVELAVDAEDCALIHGPPGTGKTYTIARTIRALVAEGNRVLLSAFTNRAVDNALEALRDQGFDDVLRVGTETGVREDMRDVRLVQRGEPNAKAAELRDAPVVAATTAACGSRVMRECEFDVALVDEASQLTEPGTHAAVNLADRFVLVGDHEQLPPVVRAENDLRTSLFQRLIETYPDASVMLDRQYRMSQRIQAFASAEFYDGALRPATPEVAGQTLADLGVDPDALAPDLTGGVGFVDPDGERDGNRNVREAERVAAIADAYVAAGVDPDDIGVIAPFRAQVAEIGRRTDVTVDTVDRFQGSSKEVILVSLVATGDLDGPIFEDHRRMNVALTRAKKQLTLVGDADALATDPFYARMLDWARR